jgi:hypothetical protein
LAEQKIITTSKTQAKGIPLTTAETIAKEFMYSYNGNVDISVTMKEIQEEIYGLTVIRGKYGRIKGAYNGKGSSVLGLVSGKLHSSADARVTLRHEILGHSGLDTFKKADKQ